MGPPEKPPSIFRRGLTLKLLGCLSAAGHPQAASIKSRKSRTANETYLSNGCIRCDALFGQFFISEDLADVVVKGAVNSLPILVNVTRPAIEWHALAGLSATSGNLT
jgi:hypothetical protein